MWFPRDLLIVTLICSRCNKIEQAANRFSIECERSSDKFIGLISPLKMLHQPQKFKIYGMFDINMELMMNVKFNGF